jgi:hypothetical protein
VRHLLDAIHHGGSSTSIDRSIQLSFYKHNPPFSILRHMMSPIADYTYLRSFCTPFGFLCSALITCARQFGVYVLKVKPTTQNTTGSSASAQTSRTIVNVVKQETSCTRPFLDCFTLGARCLDSSSWRVRVQVSGQKLVDQTAEIILWSVIFNVANFGLIFVDQWRKEFVESFNCKWNDGMMHCTIDLLQMQWRPSELTKFHI